MKSKRISRGHKGFDVVFGFDMETDVGSFTSDYEGVKHGTPRLLSMLRKHDIKGTFFWTGHAAESNPEAAKMVRDAGHEIGCHGLFHETLGDPIFPLPNNWPVLPDEVEGRLRRATRIVKKVSGVQPRSFRCPRLWGSTKVVNALEKLGYVSDASLPLFFYRSMIVPYHPSSRDWTKRGRMKIVEIPIFCDLTMKSNDPYNRDRDQWPLFRTKGASYLMRKAESFIGYVRKRNQRPVLCFYFHPWEFHEMPQGAISFGEASVKPFPFIVKNCGETALREFDQVCLKLREKGARFVTAREIAKGIESYRYRRR